MAKKSSKENKDAVKENREEIAKALEILFAKDYISKKRLYYENFLRGIFFSAGGIIGATIVITLLVWVLSLFDQIPLIGPFFEKTRNTIQQGSTIR